MAVRLSVRGQQRTVCVVACQLPLDDITRQHRRDGLGVLDCRPNGRVCRGEGPLVPEALLDLVLGGGEDALVA